MKTGTKQTRSQYLALPLLAVVLTGMGYESPPIISITGKVITLVEGAFGALAMVICFFLSLSVLFLNKRSLRRRLLYFAILLGVSVTIFILRALVSYHDCGEFPLEEPGNQSPSAPSPSSGMKTSCGSSRLHLAVVSGQRVSNLHRELHSPEDT